MRDVVAMLTLCAVTVIVIRQSRRIEWLTRAVRTWRVYYLQTLKRYHRVRARKRSRTHPNDSGVRRKR